MAILGLVSTESTGVASNRWTNIRRRVFYQYPNGAAPIIGLLSMMKEDETNDPKYSHWEKRLKEARDVTAGAGPVFQDNAGGALADPFNWTANTSYRVLTTLDHTGANALFRKGHVVKIAAKNAAGTVLDIRGIITGIAATYITVRAVHTQNGVESGAGDNLSVEILAIGTAFHQGTVDLSSEIYYIPVNIENYTQIFRTPFSFTGTQLVVPVKFDDTGIYKDKAKQHSIDHMVEMELAVLFGMKSLYTPAGSSDPLTGTGLPVYTFGGILYHMSQYELTAANPYEAAGATLDADDGKRIITNAAGTIDEKTFDTYLERIFRTTSNVSNEKLVLCGSGFLKVVNQLYRSLGQLQLMVPSQDTFGMELVAHKTAFGTIYYKSHPLFSRNNTLRNNALFTDIHNLRYRPMSKRDTQLLKNRQPNDADYRKDEWFTETGLEVRMPDSFLYYQNVTSFVP